MRLGFVWVYGDGWGFTLLGFSLGLVLRFFRVTRVSKGLEVNGFRVWLG